MKLDTYNGNKTRDNLVMGLSKKICVKNMLGLMVAAVGVGIVLAVLVPLWGWLIVIGGGLIYCGWCCAERWF